MTSPPLIFLISQYIVAIHTNELYRNTRGKTHRYNVINTVTLAKPYSTHVVEEGLTDGPGRGTLSGPTGHIGHGPGDAQGRPSVTGSLTVSILLRSQLPSRRGGSSRHLTADPNT